MTDHSEMQVARSQSSAASEHGPLSRKTFLITIIATSLGFVLVQLDVSIVNVALPQIGTDLRTDVAGLQWVVDSYALLFASLLLFAEPFPIGLAHAKRLWADFVSSSRRRSSADLRRFPLYLMLPAPSRVSGQRF